MYERYRYLGRVCFETPGEGGGGGGNGGEQRDKVRASDLLTQYGGDAVRMAEKLAELHNDNYTLRRKRDDLATEVTTLKGRQVPEGAVVLTGDQVVAWEAFGKLGKPDEIATRLGERDALAAEVATAKRNETLREVAELAGWNPAPLRRIGADREYELREQTVEGKTVKVPFIKDGDTFKPLAEYAQSEWADVLPALTATGGQGQGNGTGGGGTQNGGGVVYPAQRGGQGQPANPGMAYLTSAYKGPPKQGG